jgi:diguanylate cyclase (GGDEF)-like protein
MAHQRCILLHSRDPEHCLQWESWLAGIGLDTLLSRKLLTMTLAQVSDLPEIALAITDEPVDLTQLGLSRCRVARGEIGLITVGCAVPADVNLPADVTAGELQLACRLLAQIVALRADLARERERKTELQTLVETDPLTKLPNRRAWEAKLQSLLGPVSADSSVGGEQVLAMFDIDGFKRRNDEEGHAAADDQLVEIARLLAKAVRREDFLARWGGDEFALLLADLPLHSGQVVIERIRQSATTFGPRPLTLSAGWARVGEKAGCPAPSDAFEAADAALREAKQAGGDQTREGVVGFREQVQAAAG